jgi:hypothetical protein
VLVTTASLAWLEPAALTVTVPETAGRDPAMRWSIAKATALERASRRELPWQGPAQPGQCPSPSEEAAYFRHPGERCAWEL